MEFNYPSMVPWVQGPVCQNAILCYPAYIGHSITEAPLVFINHNIHIITKDALVLTSDDFDDPHYVYWRNSQDPDFTFLELFFGPLFSALSVGVFFLICRTFEFSRKNSTVLTLFFGLTTTVWAYSQTSLNSIPLEFFILLGFLFFRKFQSERSAINLILCGTSFGFAFLVRPDAILFIIPLFFFLLNDFRKQDKKIKKFLFLITPLIVSYGIYRIIDYVRIGTSLMTGVSSSASTVASIGNNSTLPVGIFGLLLSPGAGLLIFSPILFTIFLSFPDFYKKHKRDCILLLSFIALFLINYGASSAWHGFVSWGARYLLPIIPFLLLPLGATLEKRRNKILNIFLVSLGGVGFFFNIVYLIQDVSWFVWTYPGSHTGLFGLAQPGDALYLNPSTFWTFENSQLTHSIIMMFQHLQPDIFLLKLFGPLVYGFVIAAILSVPIYLLFNLFKQKSKPVDYHLDSVV